MVKVVPVFSWATCKHDILPVRRLRAIAWNQQRPAFSQRQLEPLGHPMCSLQVEPLVPKRETLLWVLLRLLLCTAELFRTASSMNV